MFGVTKKEILGVVKIKYARITVPAELRKRYGLRDGDKAVWVIREINDKKLITISFLRSKYEVMSNEKMARN